MKKEQLEMLIGKNVKIWLVDGDVITGQLHKTGEEQFKEDLNLYLPRNYYFLLNPLSSLFRSSYVKKIEVHDNKDMQKERNGDRS